jgi:predicted ATPase
MEPDDRFAVCPKCGRKDDTALVQPLFVVTGAAGSGKTTIFGPLARLLAGRCIVFDVDWLLDASSTLAGGAAPHRDPLGGI